jgi:hypothetical protein
MTPSEMGRIGGSANTAAQNAARAKNAKNGGRKSRAELEAELRAIRAQAAREGWQLEIDARKSHV